MSNDIRPKINVLKPSVGLLPESYITHMLRSGLWIGFMLLLANVCCAQHQMYFVAPNGNDHNPGTQDKPFKTICHARDTIRNIQPTPSGPVTVYLRGGVYFLDQPLVFTPEDSGTESAPRIYKAWNGEKPIISGGVQLTNWRKTSPDRWQATLPPEQSKDWNFSQLFVNDQRRPHPRLPRQGYYKIADELPPSRTPEVPIGPTGSDHFMFHPGDFHANWKNQNDIEVLILHLWSASRLRVESIDEIEHHVRFTGPTYHVQWLPLKKEFRYCIENVYEALSEPGQWYLDRQSREITYLPKPGESIESAEIIAPRLFRLVEFRGDQPNHQWVQYLSFEGLTFAHSNYILPPQGQSIGQAESILGGAVYGLGARHCTLKDCAIQHTGSYAVEWSDGCKHNHILKCELTDLGAGGVKIGRQMLYGYDPDEPASHHTVENCLIAHGGRIHPGAVGVFILSSPYNRIEHNDIHDLYYTGISIGLMGGEAFPNTWSHHNRIAYNHIHNIGQGVLGDMGGIYCMGVSPGTVVCNNLIHDIQGSRYGQAGIYMDEGASYITIENNLCYDILNPEGNFCCGFLQHYGHENKVVNNIFVCHSGDGLFLSRHVGDQEKALILEKNIFVTGDRAPIKAADKLIQKGLIVSDRNLYWIIEHNEPLFTQDITLSQRRSQGQDLNSLFADPKFVDDQNRDFRLHDDSPAFAIGFQPFDCTRAGRTPGAP